MLKLRKVLVAVFFCWQQLCVLRYRLVQYRQPGRLPQFFSSVVVLAADTGVAGVGGAVASEGGTTTSKSLRKNNLRNKKQGLRKSKNNLRSLSATKKSSGRTFGAFSWTIAALILLTFICISVLMIMRFCCNQSEDEGLQKTKLKPSNGLPIVDVKVLALANKTQEVKSKTDQQDVVTKKNATTCKNKIHQQDVASPQNVTE